MGVNHRGLQVASSQQFLNDRVDIKRDMLDQDVGIVGNVVSAGGFR